MSRFERLTSSSGGAGSDTTAIHRASGSPPAEANSAHIAGVFTADGGLATAGAVQGAGITGTQVTASVATGTPPLVVNSTTKVPNLHADTADTALIAGSAATATSATTATNATKLNGDRIERGVYSFTLLAGATGTVVLTYSSGFTLVPQALIQILMPGGIYFNSLVIDAVVLAVSTTQLTIEAVNNDAVFHQVDVMYLVIGPV